MSNMRCYASRIVWLSWPSDGTCFRAMASTAVNERFRSDVIEQQLAHQELLIILRHTCHNVER
jgi:hypothetical protein